jgi:uncharacterized protein (TIGR03086 family)
VTKLGDEILDRFLLSSSGFERALRAVPPMAWTWRTPCAEWDIRQLVNHMIRGNLGYTRLSEGGSGADFLRLRDVDALGADPLASYVRSVAECAEAFAAAGVLDAVLDYPLGPVTGRQALAVRTTDSVIHTWDLARAVGVDERLDPGLVDWIDDSLDEIYAGLTETPTATETTHRFFAAPGSVPVGSLSRQDRLLHRMGRNPWLQLPR